MPEAIGIDMKEIEPRDFKPQPKRTQILARATSAKPAKHKLVQLSPQQTSIVKKRLQSAKHRPKVTVAVNKAK